MAVASYLQTSFLGGKWSPFAQGRADMETYRTALNECMNFLPVPVGAAVRRQGTLFGATTRSGVQAVARTFAFTQAQPYTLEFTSGHMRMWAGMSLVLELPAAVSQISSANPAVVYTPSGHGYSTGDQVEFTQLSLVRAGTSPSGLKYLFNRQFAITVIDSTHFSIADPVTGAGINGALINMNGWNVQVARIVDTVVPYLTADLQNIRVVQSEDVALVLCPGYTPRQIVNLHAVNTTGAQTISFGTTTFLDGPYLDPPTDGSTLTASGTSGSVTLTASATTSINGGSGFQSTDVGRFVRLFYQPAQWASGTSYNSGQNVTYNNAYYQSIVSGNVGHEPDTDPGTHWAVATTAAQYTWAIITAVTSTTVVTATIQAADPLGFLAGGPLPSTTPAMTVWQLGAYSATTTYPTGGTFHEGRFWLFSAFKNRIDGTVAGNNGTLPQNGLQFAPTMLDGTVADNNGIAAVMENTDVNPIFWAASTETGIVLGTQAGEWNLIASAFDDPITPTSIQAKRKTHYGCSNVEPVVAPLATLFIQRYNRHLIEYVNDPYSRKWTGTNLAEKAQDIILPGLAEIALVLEPVPVCWARTTDNRLVGMSYKRETPFGTQPATFAGWHHHTLGSGRQVVSLRSGPAAYGNTDNVSMVTLDPSTGVYFMEFMAPYFDETSTLNAADFVDAAATPMFAEISGSNLILYGLTYLIGKTVTSVIGGVDGGDFVVASDGSLTIPLPGGYNGSGLLTQAYLSAQNYSGNFQLNIQVSPPGSGYNSPVASILSYVSSHNATLHNSAVAQSAIFDFDALGGQGQFYYLTGDGYVNGFNVSTQAQTILTTNAAHYNNSGAICLGYDGNIYYTGLNSNTIYSFNVTTLTESAGTTFASEIVPAYMSAIKGIDGNTYLLMTSLDQAGGAPVSVTNAWWVARVTGAGAPVAVGSGDFACGISTGVVAGTAYTLRGPVGSAYALVYGNSTPGTGTNLVNLFRITVGLSGAGMTKVGSVNAASVNSGLTSLSIPNQFCMVYDETDGNVICTVEGSDSNYYLIKISAYDCSVLWSLPIGPALNVDYHHSRIQGGRFNIISGTSPYTLNEIDTIAGTNTTSVHESLMGIVNFAYNDRLGIFVGQVNDIGTTIWDTFGPAPGGGVIVPATVYSAPTLIGFTYTSQLQLLRPVVAQELQTQQGPGLGKKRRTAEVAWLFANTQGVSMGTDFTATMRPADFRIPVEGPTEIPLTQLFTGTYWDQIEDDWSYDSMPGLQVTRPYPANVMAVEAFVHTEEKAT